jgi:adenylate cyclase
MSLKNQGGGIVPVNGVADPGTALGFGLSALDVRRELDRVSSSEFFQTSERNRRFLDYVVNEALAGRGDRIKAYNIATSVFGRGADFDPQTDTIVRIEAGRLRRALEHFYLTCGEHGPVRISIPTGAYVPSFVPTGGGTTSDPLIAAVALAKGRWRGPRVFIAAFDQETDDARLPDLGRRFAQQLIRSLTLFDGIFVYGVHTSETLSADIATLTRELDVDFILTGSVLVTPRRFEVAGLLQRISDGRYVWASEFKRDIGPASLMAAREEIAASIARVLGQRYGVIFSHTRDNTGHPPTDFRHYRAILDFYDYWRDFDPTLYEPVRTALEQVVVEDPNYAEAFACLSLLYTNAVRYGYDLASVVNDPMARATKLADEAIRLAPGSSKAFFAQALARWFGQDMDGAMSSLRIAHDLNPNDDEILADLGLRHAVRMEWDEALPLVELAYRRNPYQTSSYRVALFLYHFANKRYEQALKEAQAIGASAVAYSHLAKAAAQAELNQFDTARQTLDELDRVSPGYLTRMESDLAIRNVHSDIVAALRSAIDKVHKPSREIARRVQPRLGASVDLAPASRG